MSCGIYMIENKINHHKYIGLSKNIERRWKEHINKSKHSLKKDDMDKALYKAIRKYGEENFIFTILEECEEKELKEREKFWIEYYNTYKNRKDYNETPGGDCSGINNVHVGEEHGMALLTEEEVRFCRIQYANGKRCKEIYLKYFKDKISYSGFSRMWHGKTWKHVMPETFNYNGDYPITEESKKQKILEKLKKTNYFHHKNNVIMCRIYDKSIEVYSINIKKFHKKKGDKKYE